MSSYRHLIEYAEFVQRVRRHRPSELLPAIAATALRLHDQAAWMKDRVRFPWALAGAAKASIVSGNDHRSPGVGEHDVWEICAAYNAVKDLLGSDARAFSASVTGFEVRLATEQFDWQHPPFQEVGRLAALLDGVDQLETEILNSAFIERVMGCTLTEFAGTGLALWAIASNSRGFCEPDTFDALSGDAPIDTGISAKVMCRVFSDHFTTTFPQFKEDVTTRLRLNGPPHKHDFNPLTKWPIIELPDGRHLAPQPAHIYRTCTSPLSTIPRWKAWAIANEMLSLGTWAWYSSDMWDGSYSSYRVLPSYPRSSTVATNVPLIGLSFSTSWSYLLKQNQPDSLMRHGSEATPLRETCTAVLEMPSPS